MPKKVLQVLDNAYRCTVEEQDDPIIWITHAMRGAGADLSVLLRGSAVNYAVQSQDPSGLSFGGRKQNHPANLARDVSGLSGKDVSVFAVREDVEQRGISTSDLVGSVELISRDGVTQLFEKHDEVWHW